MSAEPNLAAIRREIDSIDDSIHELIQRRTGLVEHIRSAKSGGDFYRPAREAEILRRLIARHTGPFPKLALVRMWREMITAITRLQGPFSVAAYLPDHQPGYWDLARIHFGATVEITMHRAARAVIAAVRDRKASVGILPLPRDEDADPWWPDLGGAKDPLYIVAKLPFAPGGVRTGELEALVIGRLVQEPSGDDHTFLLVETAGEVSRDRIASAMKSAGLDPCFLTSRAGRGSNALVLVEIADFVPPGDQRLAALAETPGITAVPVGGFATPLTATALAPPRRRK